SSAPCTSRTASTSPRLGAAARSRPCSSWSGTRSEASPIAVNGFVDPRQQRRNHESCTNTRWRRVCTADHAPPTRWCSEPLGIPGSRPSVAAQPARSCRKASARSAGSAERISSRTGWRRSSSASTYDDTSTPLTTRLLTSPSMTASCITTPIRRARVKSHSRNSASVRSWSLNVAIPGSIYQRADTRAPWLWNCQCRHKAWSLRLKRARNRLSAPPGARVSIGGPWRLAGLRVWHPARHRAGQDHDRLLRRSSPPQRKVDAHLAASHGAARCPPMSVLVIFPGSRDRVTMAATRLGRRKDGMETAFALSEIDTTTPHPARMYDALLGGEDNYAADRQAVRQLLKVAPEARDSARPTGRSCSGRCGSWSG